MPRRRNPPQRVQIQQSQMPPWMEALQRGMGERAYAIRQEPYTPFPGVPNYPARLAQFPRDYRMLHYPRDIRRAHELGREEDVELPNFNRAEQFGEMAGKSFPSRMQRYMNPYQEGVINEIYRHGTNQLNKQIGQLQSRFAGTGGARHSRFQDKAGELTREMMEDLHGRAARALGEGYQTAAQIHASDASRRANLMEQFRGLGQARRIGRGADIAQLSGQGMEQMGRAQQAMDTGYQDFLRQQGHPYEQLQRQAAVMHGIPYNQQNYAAEQAPQYRENAWGRLGNVAQNMMGLNMMMGQNRKRGGSIQGPKMKKMPKMGKLGKMGKMGKMNKMQKMSKMGKKPGAQSLMSSSFVRHPKVGGNHTLQRNV